MLSDEVVGDEVVSDEVVSDEVVSEDMVLETSGGWPPSEYGCFQSDRLLTG